MVARELGVSSKDVREMESRMAAQDMTFDMSSDDESDSQPMAPVLYLQDKSSNFADGIEEDNWEDQAANKLTHAMEGLDERSGTSFVLVGWTKTTSRRCRNWPIVTAFPLNVFVSLKRTP